MFKLTPHKEEGLKEYRKIQSEISYLERRLIGLAEKGKTDNYLVKQYNQKVDELGEVARHYDLV